MSKRKLNFTHDEIALLIGLNDDMPTSTILSLSAEMMKSLIPLIPEDETKIIALANELVKKSKNKQNQIQELLIKKAFN